MQASLPEDPAQRPRLTVLGAASRPLTHSEKFRPTAPPSRQRFRQMLRQLMQLPRTLAVIWKIIRQDLSFAALDESLWSFWGFHQESSDSHYRMRPWEKVQLGNISPRDVVGGQPVWELAFMMNFAMESEDPIFEYTQNSGEGFRFLLPSLGRFMGKNHEQARYAAEHNLPWCESPWCAEERRHSNAFARMIERLTGFSPDRENPNQPAAVASDEASAVRHMLERQASEWNASSSYIVMAAHSKSGLRTLLRNIVRDEIKHLAILSCADFYLFGPRHWKRVLRLIQLGLENYRAQRTRRSGGDCLGGNFVLSIEGAVAHALTALYLTRWIKTVPLRTLAEVFDLPSKLPELAAFAPSKERQAEIDRVAREGIRQRTELARWDDHDRRLAFKRMAFAQVNNLTVEEIVQAKLDGLHEAAVLGSGGEKKARRRIARIGNSMLRACLIDRLRDFQIKNNRHVITRAENSSNEIRTPVRHREHRAREGELRTLPF